MCHHRYEIELQPSPDPDSWSGLETVSMLGGVRLPEDERERGLALARSLARDYALAYPQDAHHLRITRWRCAGPEESETPFPDRAVASDDDTGRLARENMKLRAALRLYADPTRWQVRFIAVEPGLRGRTRPQIHEDVGASARVALYGDDTSSEAL